MKESNFKKCIGDAADEEKSGGFLPKNVARGWRRRRNGKQGGGGGVLRVIREGSGAAMMNKEEWRVEERKMRGAPREVFARCRVKGQERCKTTEGGREKKQS